MKSLPFGRARWGAALLPFLVASLAAAQDLCLEGYRSHRFSPPLPSAQGLESLDIDGDGDVDHVLGMISISDRRFAVMRNVGNGSLAPVVQYTFAGGSTDGLVVGDLDGDGDPDVLLWGNLTLSLCLNDGSGNFGSPTQITNSGAFQVRLGDVDADGDLDIVQLDSQVGAVRVFKNLGAGTFATPTSYGPTANNMRDFRLGDLDGDGDLDAVIAEEFNPEIVLFNDGAGGFTTHYTSEIGLLWSVGLVDLDADGDLDLTALRAGGILVAINSGSGTFGTPTASTLAVAGNSRLLISDVDGDGDSDIVVPDQLSLIRNLGTGALGSAEILLSQGSARAVAAADVDGDGDVDIAALTAGRFLTYVENRGGGSFQFPMPAGQPRLIADLDQDGDGDAVTLGTSLSVALNQGGLSFAVPTSYPLVGQPKRVAAADVDGDGDLDLVSTSNTVLFGPGRVAVYPNLGDGTFAAAVPYATGTSYEGLAVGDADGDGDLDVVAGTIAGFLQPTQFALFRNQGNGTFAAPTFTPSQDRLTWMLLEDLDGDADLDVAAISGTGTLLVHMNDGSGGFGPATTYGFAQALAARDMDADGDVDLITNEGTVRILVNPGNGVFSGSPVLVGPSDLANAAIAIADLDGDGDPEILAGDSQVGRVSVLVNTGGLSFTERLWAYDSTGTTGILGADVDGDGAAEIVVNGANDRFAILRNCGNVGTTFCLGDGSGTPCPCGNTSAPGADAGCLNSLGLGATLRVGGSPSIANDTLVLTGAGMPNIFALYFQGTTQSGGGAGTTFGDGLRCAGGTVVRLGTKLNVANGSRYPEPGDLSVSARGLVMVPGSRTYQVWYRNAASYCTPGTFNLSNGILVSWAL